MTHADKGKYFQKHPGQTEVAGDLQQKILQKVTNNGISCAGAEETAQNSGLALRKVGIAIDMLNINIIECQLGLFGYSPQKKVVQPAERVAASLKDEIEKSLVSRHLPCAAAWGIARKLNLPRMRVSAACEALQIKIKPCQLGAF
ncbi:MAG: hypothetical protein L7F78_03600 [Syntrophales bacterium LBB04]|nr:hypothetical protein [Syntrophales bacterium LBB04]